MYWADVDRCGSSNLGGVAMTLREAIETGLEYKLPEHGSWWDENRYSRRFSGEDILRDDWIVKREPIVFECSWYHSRNGEAVPTGLSAEEIRALDGLIGKKTRMTVEVIE